MIGKSAKFIVEAIKNGSVTAYDVAKETLEYAKKVNEKTYAFISIDEEKVLEAAAAVDRKRAAGEPLGPLAGVPIAIKDNILVKDEPLTCASKMLKDNIAIYDATVIKKIRDADGIPFGRTNLDEFAMGSSTENSAMGISKNPWDLGRVPGGSSGGSAAAVASLVVPLALGSDTGGSVRQPAAFCGLKGLKPTYGRVSRYGLVSFGSSLDQVGIFAREATDAALLMSVISGFDAKDSTSAKEGHSDFLSTDNNIKGIKVAVLDSKMIKGVDPAILQALKETVIKLEELGAEIKYIDMDAISHAIEAYYIIAPAEVSSNLSRLDGIKYGSVKKADSIDELYLKTREQFGDEVKRRIMIGNYVLSAGHYDSYYKKAYQVRRIVKNQFDVAFEHADLILMPTTPTTAFKFGENTSDPVKMYLSDIFTVSANLAGVPAISFPVGFSQNLPIGMQLLGKYFNESLLLRAVDALDKVIEIPEMRRLDV